MIYPQEGAPVWDQIILSVLTGVAGIITAMAGFRAASARTVINQLVECQTRSATDQTFRRVALRHIADLERAWWQAGMSAPVRPDELLS